MKVFEFILSSDDSSKPVSDAERLFSNVASRVMVTRRMHLWHPPTDVLETDHSIVVLVELAGMGNGEINVDLNGRQLTISGIRGLADKYRKYFYHRMEVNYGEFRTEVQLPAAVDPDKVEANYADGLLEIVLPRRMAKVVDISEE